MMPGSPIDNGPPDGDFAKYLEALTRSENQDLMTQSAAVTNAAPQKVNVTPTAGATSTATVRAPHSGQVRPDLSMDANALRAAFAPIVPMAVAAFVLFSAGTMLPAPFGVLARVAALVIAVFAARRILGGFGLARKRKPDAS